MGRPKGSKNAAKDTAEELHENMADPAVVPGDPPIPEDAPPPDVPELPNRLQEHIDAEAAAKVESDAKGQQFFDGLAPERHPAVDECAERYNAIKLARCKLTKDEAEAKQSLLLKMIAHGLPRYKTNDGWIVEVVNDQKVKTRREDGESVSGVTHSGAINPPSDDDSTNAMDDDERDIDDAGEVD